MIGCNIIQHPRTQQKKSDAEQKNFFSSHNIGNVPCENGECNEWDRFRQTDITHRECFVLDVARSQFENLYSHDDALNLDTQCQTKSRNHVHAEVADAQCCKRIVWFIYFVAHGEKSKLLRKMGVYELQKCTKRYELNCCYNCFVTFRFIS